MSGCLKCGRCCKFIPLPPLMTLAALRTVGVPLNLLGLEWARLRIGIRVVGRNMRLDPETPVTRYDGRLGTRMLAAAPCSWLRADGRCEQYEQRPALCRTFTEATARGFAVPNGCALDPGGLGEDFTGVLSLARGHVTATNSVP